jgi:hypothetical protein
MMVAPINGSPDSLSVTLPINVPEGLVVAGVLCADTLIAHPKNNNQRHIALPVKFIVQNMGK